MCDLRTNASQFIRLFYGFLGKDQSKLSSLYSANAEHQDNLTERAIKGYEDIVKCFTPFDFVGKRFHIDEFSVFLIDDQINLTVFGFPINLAGAPETHFVHNFILTPQFKLTTSIFAVSAPKSFEDIYSESESLMDSIDIYCDKMDEPVIIDPPKEQLEPPKEPRGWGPNICPPGLTPPAHGILPKHVMAFTRISQTPQGDNKPSEPNQRPRGPPRQNEGRERSFGDDYKQLFVGNLPGDIKEATLREYFSRFGAVVDARVSRSKNYPNSRPFGFIRFDSEEPVARALSHKGHNLDGHRINVEQKNSNRDSRDHEHDRPPKKQFQ